MLEEIETAHGKLPGGRVVLVGMGKLGSFELTAGSDIDLILLYDHDGEAFESDGPKPLDNMKYFTRITQRLIAALSAPTAEGVLYEVDMRLRPSGNKGPVATRITSFAKYQTEEAWTWEHMALTRARVLCGDESLVQEAGDIFRAVLGRKREAAKIAKDVAEMRHLIDQEKPPKDIWDLKLIAGGLIDIEFIAQFLALMAPARGVPQPERAMPTGEALAVLGAAMMDPNDLDTVQRALVLYTEISQIVRLCVDGSFDPKEAPAGLIDLVCRAGDSPDIRTLEADLKQRSKAVRKIFHALVAKP